MIVTEFSSCANALVNYINAPQYFVQMQYNCMWIIFFNNPTYFVLDCIVNQKYIYSISVHDCFFLAGLRIY